jgi:hypothetical protein
MDCKAKDWIEHPSFGLGRVSEDRGDRLVIDFINSGAKTILKTTELKPAVPPSPDFKFPQDKNKSRTSQMSANMHVHASFGDFINSAVIPHQAAHPEWKRLDGWDREPSKSQKGNRTIFAQFRHAGRTWKVHADTKFAPLMEAYMKQDGDPFVEEPTNTKQGTKLQTRPPSKWMFIYLVVP